MAERERWTWQGKQGAVADDTEDNDHENNWGKLVSWTFLCKEWMKGKKTYNYVHTSYS